MEKKLFSIFLILCMVMTLLPIPAMAEQSHIKADRNGDIIVFAPLAETEKSVAIGTSIEELELPKTLTATVLTNPDLSMQVDTNHETVLDSVYDSGYENIPVNVSVAKWTSEPEYDMDTEGEYVFTPVIEGYIVNALLPEIAVTVGEMPLTAVAMPLGVGAQTEITNFADLQSAINGAASDLDLKLSDSYIDTAGKLTIPGTCNYNITIDLNSKTLYGGSVSAIEHLGSGTLTVDDSSSGGTVTSITSSQGTIAAVGGSVELLDGTVSNSTSSYGAAIYTQNATLNIRGGAVSATGNGGVAVWDNSSSSLNIYGGTLSAAGSDGNAVYSTNPASRLNISGGTISAVSSIAIYHPNTTIQRGTTAIIQGGSSAMQSAPTLDGGVQVMARTNYDGSGSGDYNSENIATYKYLKFEPVAGVTEQFTLTPGGTYYFDLSGEKGNIGTVNAALPDTSLHYVPFTYAGTVNAYSLTSQTESSLNTDRSLFVGDYNVGLNISWNNLNSANLIIGKSFDTNYKLRSMSAGSSRIGSASDGSDHIGQPDTNEWDQILKKSNISGEWIKNLQSIWSWGQETTVSTFAVVRGYNTVNRWDMYALGATTSAGFRPALEVLNPITLTPDGLKAVTLNLNGGNLRGSTANINIICAGDDFTAPSGEGLTAPVGKTFDGWKDSGGTAYAAGAAVPNTVTGLTAQWAAPSVAQIGSTGYPTLQAAVDAVTEGQTIQLLEDIALTTPVNIPSTNTNNFTLDLNGKTLSADGSTAIRHSGTGTLTIADSGSGGMVLGRANTYTIRNIGTMHISSGIVSTTYINATTIYNTGTLQVSGGIVRQDGGGSESISNTGTVTISGGTIEHQNGSAIISSNSGKVIIESGTSVIKASHIAMSTPPDLSGYDNVRITASKSKIDGTETYEITRADIETNVKVQDYKYLKFEPTPATTAPTVTDERISISGATGTGGVYKIGDTVTATWNNTAAGDNNSGVTGVTVDFSQFGGGAAVAAINSGDVWTASYIITAGSIDATNRNVSVTAISAGGSTTTAGTKNATVDNKTPTVTSVSVPANGTYSAGNNLDFTVNFDENVTVNTAGATLYLPLAVGSQTKQATYVSGSGTTALTFRYTVQAGDSDTDGIGVNSSLVANGGTVRDSAGNDALLTLNNVGSTTGILVDTSEAPSITSQPSTQTVNEGQSATFSVTATGTGLTYQWQVNTGSSFVNISNGGVYSGANTSTLTITGATAGMNGYQYRAVVSGTISPAATSNSAMLTVNAAPTYTISGTIKGSDTGSGISGASVLLKNGSGPVGTPVLTDANGAYTISNVPAGTYSIDASTPGYYIGTISSVTVSASVTGKDLTLTRIMIFTPVTDIIMTNAASVQVDSDLTLVGILSPLNATNQSIVWSVVNANGTGAAIVGSTFRATSAGTATVKATITNGSTASSDYTKTFDITVTTIPVVTHTITATTSTGGSISPSGSVTVNSGTSQTFTITPTSNYSIADVKVDGVSQGKITSYTFSNVTANHTISATFNYSGSSSGGGSSSNDNSSPVIVTPPAPDKPNSPTQGEIKVPGTVDGNGNITVNITDKAVADAFNKALADAKKNGNEQNGITVVLRVDAGSKTGSNVRVNLPKAVQDTIIKNKVVNTIIVVDNPDIRIGMDLETVQEINKQAKSDVNITATHGDSSELNEDAKKAIGSRPVFDLKVNYGSGKQVQGFGAGSVSVVIPYILGANEKAENVKAVYIDENGKLHWLENSVYDSVEKVVRFSTNHFSIYGVGYKQTQTESTDTDRDTTVTDTTSADISFTDIADHWAKADIEYVVRQGLFNGMSTATFSPNTAMTRGMFVTVLGRMANADVNSYKKSSFIDVASDGYYMGYLEWARKNSIVKGIGNGKFAPDRSITREQMAVIMQNYAKVIGFTLPKAHKENTFADSANISAYAKDAVQQMQMAGVIGGKDRNLFDPQGTATRAEVAAVLRRFMELAISNDAM